MTNRRSLNVLVFLSAVLVAGVRGPLSAGQQTPASLTRPTVARAAGTATGGSTIAVITGHALNGDRAPLPFARVRLRNLDNGAIVAKTSADHVGEFSFLVPSGGTYIAELVDESDDILAAGDVLTVVAGQTVGTLIMLPAKPPSLAGLFGNSAAAIVSAAAGAGITAVTTGQPLSPEK